jgi:flagellar export protein FliJ
MPNGSSSGARSSTARSRRSKGQIEQARDALKDAFAELKKFELAAEAAEERARKKRDAREQTALDEVALGIFRRQAK